MLFSDLYFKKEAPCLIGEAKYASLIAILSTINV
jgi:hypothetical protein